MDSLGTGQRSISQVAKLMPASASSPARLWKLASAAVTGKRALTKGLARQTKAVGNTWAGANNIVHPFLLRLHWVNPYPEDNSSFEF